MDKMDKELCRGEAQDRKFYVHMFHIALVRKNINTQTTSVVYTQVHMLSRVVDKMDKELCGGREGSR